MTRVVGHPYHFGQPLHQDKTMIVNCCRCVSVLILLASGCTYNPVQFDPVSGFRAGGGIGVLCGGPLDPWMQHCCPQCGCAGPCPCGPATRPGTQCCPAPGCPPAPICAPAPVCAPVCPPMGVPLNSGFSPYVPGAATPFTPLPTIPSASVAFSVPDMMQPPIAAPLPSLPTYAPQMLGSAPSPLFVPQQHPAPHYPAMPQEHSCPTCGPSASAPVPNVTNYPQLFMAPPASAGMAPTPQYVDQFQMPAPHYEQELPPTGNQLPPHYNMLETPNTPMQPTPMQPTPMQPTPVHPRTQPTPMQPMPMESATPQQHPMPMPQGTEATQTSLPLLLPPGPRSSGLVQDSRRVQWVPVRN